MQRPDARHEHHGGDDDAHDEHRAEVVLQHDQRHRHGCDAERDREPPRVEIAAVLMAIGGEHDHQDDLGGLRRLELQRPELEPGRRTVAAGADEAHGQQERQRREIQQRGEVAQLAVVDRHRDDHRDETDREREHLPFDVVEAADVLEREPRPGRRIDHEDAEGGDDDRRRDEQVVDVAQLGPGRRPFGTHGHAGGHRGGHVRPARINRTRRPRRCWVSRDRRAPRSRAARSGPRSRRRTRPARRVRPRRTGVDTPAPCRRRPRCH